MRATGQEQWGSTYEGWYANGHGGDIRHKFDPADARAALECYRRSAESWRWAFRLDKETRIENRIKELQQQRAAQDWRSDPVVDLSGLPDQPKNSPAQTAQAPHGRAPDIFDEIERLDTEYNAAVQRGDLAAMKRAESQLRALEINPAKRK